ncbi:hypothetical protein TRSC58_04803 [Trypanosoma rangeli SC58]|uniref:TLDc domain-containing protein n=1 Tax=Trypanosoma rangeli SC58 TaxID=429131 RepID=A0A061J2I3_TRYRA|nr:hypothetical protein TRSC58_04803 [Trypanosoma rangeli SC58]
MGNAYTRLLSFSHSTDAGAAEGLQEPPTPQFDVSAALEEVPPDVYLKRDTAMTPGILITSKQFLTLQRHIPTRFQSRCWRLLFCSGLHGFSRFALQNSCAEELKSARGKERPAILIISAGSDGSILLGAYISCIPQASNKRYVGTEESFLFCVPASSALASSGGALRIFKPPENAANHYFMRCDNGTIAVGGGGKGPAIFLHEDLTSVCCSTFCPTFDLKESLLLLSENPNGGCYATAGADCPHKVSLEGGEPQTSVRAIQLWTIGDDYYLAS